MYCRGIPRPDTRGHGYRINDQANDLDDDNGGGGGGGAVATTYGIDDPVVAEDIIFVVVDVVVVYCRTESLPPQRTRPDPVPSRLAVPRRQVALGGANFGV